MTTSPESGTAATVALRRALHEQVGQIVVGQTAMIDATLVALIAGGHVLLEGPPGVAKTLAVNAMVRACGLEGRRIQFTPDLLPSDVTGTLTLRGGELVFRSGPVFTNMLLADEINRTPPKTQAALLEAMQERQVTVDGVAHPLPEPFIVLATQNEIEFEGTYPLPESQLDRFLLRLTIGYPSEEDERRMLSLQHRGATPSDVAQVQPVISAADIVAARATADAVVVSDEVAQYIVSIVRRTRELPSVALGASPRAMVHLLAAAKATAT